MRALRARQPPGVPSLSSRSARPLDPPSRRGLPAEPQNVPSEFGALVAGRTGRTCVGAPRLFLRSPRPAPGPCRRRTPRASPVRREAPRAVTQRRRSITIVEFIPGATRGPPGVSALPKRPAGTTGCQRRGSVSQGAWWRDLLLARHSKSLICCGNRADCRSRRLSPLQRGASDEAPSAAGARPIARPRSGTARDAVGTRAGRPATRGPGCEGSPVGVKNRVRESSGYKERCLR